jgi:NAD(P)-dependent dehydrogenase (short-subunit alcohol dehydrogenase family)
MSGNQKVSVVTGSSSGIGYETALILARNGFKTYATMRNIEKGVSLNSIAEKENLFIKIVQLDVTDQSSVKNAVETIHDESGKIDVLINNAGYGLVGALEDVSMEEIKSQFETNFYGLIRVTQAVLPIMRNQGSGKIVNISSGAGRFGFPTGSIYVSTKFAVEGLSESLAYEVEPFGIKIILVEPGVIKTNFFNASNTTKKSLNPNSPYFKMYQNMGSGFSKMIENGSTPDIVAKTVLEAISNDMPKLRYLAGNDVKQLLEGKTNMSDEDFFSMMKQNMA